ncbi:aminotransferase class IV [Fodinicurvata fenggangensis]|uniref:aminotransferase class IV n=1 Tax=Fodinicurvata fenggangensis TaxID=1121830 RepID=UPI00047CC044|nr:aminotransferase class IV [Fodinicurvata fenggangensis]
MPQNQAKTHAGTAFIEGRYLPIAEAAIPIEDWGFLHSDATYDVVHLWNGHFFRLEEHLTRFQESMKGLRLNCPYSREQIGDILKECVQRSGLKDAYVEMICTRGQPAPGSRDLRTCRNRFYAFAVPFIWLANEEQRSRGLHLSISETERISPKAVNPVIKNYHWLDFVRGLFDAYDRGAETAVLVDGSGNVIEGPGFNIFAVHGNRLTTPASGMLEGITRRTVLELAAESGLEISETALPTDRLRQADEAFISSTAGGIMPIGTVDTRPVGQQVPGRITQNLMNAYWALHDDPNFATPAYD